MDILESIGKSTLRLLTVQSGDPQVLTKIGNVLLMASNNNPCVLLIAHNKKPLLSVGVMRISKRLIAAVPYQVVFVCIYFYCIFSDCFPQNPRLRPIFVPEGFDPRTGEVPLKVAKPPTQWGTFVSRKDTTHLPRLSGLRLRVAWIVSKNYISNISHSYHCIYFIVK